MLSVQDRHEPMTISPFDDARLELRRRMNKPQRHRLLHGFPLAAAMPLRESAEPGTEFFFTNATDRQLLIGVLPHPFCNPTVSGCGFCTFPHEKFNAAISAQVVEHVILEIDQRLALQPELRGRKIAGLYFGGGTANLTPPESFRRLCQALARAFDFSGAEVTLEGVPAYFVKRRPLLIDILQAELPARHYRLSMGIQTFDDEQLRRMGRAGFGNRDTFREVVELGHRLGCTVSGDMLMNLPGQTLEAMCADVEQAMAVGLDHLGLYHLVMFPGLGTAWSQDRELLAQLPGHEEAAENWLHLRARLLANGFHQTTLTNFERQEFQGSPRRFQYEENSFETNRFDMLGFGRSGICAAGAADFGTAWKTMNPTGAGAYIQAVQQGTTAWERYFHYGPLDLRIFYLTRRLAGLSIQRSLYQKLFGTDLTADFPEEYEALAEEALLEVDGDVIRPTPRGNFYADSIAALIAWRRLRHLRTHLRMPPGIEGDFTNDNGGGSM